MPAMLSERTRHAAGRVVMLPMRSVNSVVANDTEHGNVSDVFASPAAPCEARRKRFMLIEQ